MHDGQITARGCRAELCDGRVCGVEGDVGVGVVDVPTVDGTIGGGGEGGISDDVGGEGACCVVLVGGVGLAARAVDGFADAGWGGGGGGVIG